MIPIETRINSIDLANVLHYLFEHDIKPVNWEDVEHVEITRAFLNDPQSFIRHL